jgi:hypothetical protein
MLGMSATAVVSKQRADGRAVDDRADGNAAGRRSTLSKVATAAMGLVAADDPAADGAAAEQRGGGWRLKVWSLDKEK